MDVVGGGSSPLTTRNAVTLKRLRALYTWLITTAPICIGIVLSKVRDNISKMTQNVQKNVNILEFRDYIRNHREKYIQLSSNMPGIGSLIRELKVEN